MVIGARHDGVNKQCDDNVLVVVVVVVGWLAVEEMIR